MSFYRKGKRKNKKKRGKNRITEMNKNYRIPSNPMQKLK